ncbi:MAG TPA: hypothetical protein VL860_05530 [Planctomycetota bacterium]|nr:hypothetical protein [Planctomycetota bacterium]
MPLFVAWFLYGVCIGAWVHSQNQDGSPEVRGGVPVLVNHNQVVALLTPAEYPLHQDYELRGVSALASIFCAFGVVLTHSSFKMFAASRARIAMKTDLKVEK